MNTNDFKKLFSLLLFFIAFYSVAAFSIDLTPNTNGGSGQLPSGYSHINFTTYDGNWARNIALPLQPVNGNSVTLISLATFDSYLDARSVGLGPEMPIYTRDNLTFTFNASQQRWLPSGPQVTVMSPNLVGPNIPTLSARITIYQVYDGNWTPDIRLPAQASPQNLLLIRSTATYNARILADSLLFASTTTLRNLDTYGLQYRTDLQKWVINQPAAQRLDAGPAVVQMPTPVVPVTQVNFDDQHFIPSIKLPVNANNRDRVIIRSTAAQASIIDNANTNLSGPMTLANGYEYQFFYIVENQAGRRWQLISSPISVYQAQNLPNGLVPALGTPRTRVELSPGNFVPQLTLPQSQTPGARLIVNNNAVQATTVHFSGLAYSVLPGELVSFKVGDNGLWQKETITIDILMAYSDLARISIGQAAIQARNIESLGLINDGLENSGANFRVRLVGLRELVQPANWTTINIILEQIRINPTVQGWRDELRADTVTYLSTAPSSSCGGLAFVNTKPDTSNMVAVVSIACDTIAMRHEFGHNMGLYHGGNQPVPLWARGDEITHTIMAGNAIPFYSTPQRFTAVLGIAMGAIDSVDAVRLINTNSPAVAAFR